MSESEIFAAATRLSGEARREFVHQACGGNDELRRDIEALLSAHDQSFGIVPEVPDRAPISTRIMPELVEPGTIIAGRYKLLEPIGEGGMGTVWVAEQKEPVRRKVAVKLIKAGMDSRAVLARFDAERQALAVMDHTHIARVFDGGVTEQGRPYFVMELVKGVPLTDYCDQVQMELRERLELFSQVCSAVQHAHQKGIIHRDLKPSNILVTEYDGKPVCKVIDFGLAKAIHGAHTLTDASLHTAFGAVVGTPLYMAPEQLVASALDVDTRADLYSLGVVLYELLTGSTPIERERLKKAALEEIMRIVREEEPAIPSHRLSSSDTLPSVAARRHIEPARLTRLVRGDLDWIVMKSLEKDRNRRYETANGLSMDIQRFLAGEAVLAAPPSRIYRFRKFIRKHRGPVLAATLLGLSLIGGMMGTSWGFYRASESAKAERRAKDDAENRRIEAETARQAAELQQTRAEAREQEAIDAVRRFGDAVSNNPELKDHPSLESLRKELLKEPLAFFQSLRSRLEADASTTPESLARLARAGFDLARLTHEIGDKQYALQAYQHSLAIDEKLARDNPTVTQYQSDLAASHQNIGVLLGETGKLTEALQAYEQALAIQERLAREHPTVTEFQIALARSHNSVGATLDASGKPTEALQAYEQALAIRERLVREHPMVTQFQSELTDSHQNIGLLLSETGKPAEAFRAYEQALKIRERLAREHPTMTQFQSDLANCHNNIGALLVATGKPAEALHAFGQALTIRERLAGEHSSVTEYWSRLADSYNNIGTVLSATGKLAEALQAYERGLAIYDRLTREHPAVTEFHRRLAASHFNIGKLLSETGKPAEALHACEQALEIYERLAGEQPEMPMYQSNAGATLNNIAMIDLQSGRFGDARDRLRKAIEFQKRALAININHPTYRQFLKNHYNNLLNAAHGLHDGELAIEARRGLRELAMSAPAAEANESRLKAVAEGAAVNDVPEALQLGQYAYDTFRYSLATRLYADALAQDVALASNRQMQIPYNAACCAALAASGQSLDDPPLDNEAQTKLRQQALSLLQGELQSWQGFLATANAQQRAFIAATLKHWQEDTDLARIRDAEELAKLPAAEREAFEALWKQVAELITKASSAGNSEKQP
jgi:eukaryotic-like serine/threonine-protein kinase